MLRALHTDLFDGRAGVWKRRDRLPVLLYLTLQCQSSIECRGPGANEIVMQRWPELSVKRVFGRCRRLVDDRRIIGKYNCCCVSSHLSESWGICHASTRLRRSGKVRNVRIDTNTRTLSLPTPVYYRYQYRTTLRAQYQITYRLCTTTSYRIPTTFCKNVVYHTSAVSATSG